MKEAKGQLKGDSAYFTKGSKGSPKGGKKGTFGPDYTGQPKGKGKGREEKGDKSSKGKSKGKGKDSGKAQTPHVPPPPQVQTPRSRAERDVNGVPIAKTDAQGNRLNLCYWFQTEHHGKRCPRKQNECDFIHAKCRYGEFPFITKPKAKSPTPTSKSPSPKSKAKAKSKGASRPNTPPPKKHT